MVSVVISPFSFLILLICILSLFFSSLAKSLSILFLLNEPAFSFIDLCYCFLCFCFIYFCSDFYAFFPSTDFVFFCSSFSSCFKCRIRFFIWDFSCFLRWDWIAINFPIRTAFASSHRFGIVVFSLSFVSMYFFISLISSVISRLFSSALFSLLYLHFVQFFSCNWFPVS